MVCGKSLHGAKKRLKYNCWAVKEVGCFIAKSQAANQGSFELGEELSWDSELSSVPSSSFLPAKELQHVIFKSVSPFFSRLCKLQNSCQSYGVWEESSAEKSKHLVNTCLRFVLPANSYKYLFVLRHFCHDAENDIDEVCLKRSLSSLSLKCYRFQA